MHRLRVPDIALAAAAALLCVATVNAISTARAGYRVADSDRAVFTSRFAPIESRGRMGPIGVAVTVAGPGYRVDRACATYRTRGGTQPRRRLCLIVLHRGSEPPRIVAPGQVIHP